MEFSKGTLFQNPLILWEKSNIEASEEQSFFSMKIIAKKQQTKNSGMYFVKPERFLLLRYEQKLESRNAIARQSSDIFNNGMDYRHKRTQEQVKRMLCYLEGCADSADSIGM